MVDINVLRTVMFLLAYACNGSAYSQALSLAQTCERLRVVKSGPRERAHVALPAQIPCAVTLDGPVNTHAYCPISSIVVVFMPVRLRCGNQESGETIHMANIDIPDAAGGTQYKDT